MRRDERQRRKLANEIKGLSTAAFLAFGSWISGSLGAATPGTAESTAVGDIFTVVTGIDGGSPEVARADDGPFVVVWNDDGALAGRRFSAEAVPLGAVFEVAAGPLTVPHAVAMGSDGGFLVAWSEGIDGIVGRRFAADGTAIGTELELSGNASEDAIQPSIDSVPSGGFVVVWRAHGVNSSGDQFILGRRLAADGQPLGSLFQVSETDAYIIVEPDVAVGPGGDFVVAWESSLSLGDDDDSTSVQARRFDAAGTPIGSSVQVNAYTTGSQMDPAVAYDGETILVAWANELFSGQGKRSVDLRSFDSLLSQGGDAIELDEPGEGSYHQPIVDLADDGTAVASWIWAPGVGIEDARCRLRFLGADGSFASPVLAVDPPGGFTGSQGMDLSPGGRGVVVWSERPIDTVPTDLLGRRLEVPLFSDGFESGDLSRWTVP